MSITLAKIGFFGIMYLGYVWAFVEIIAGQPFDGLVLFLVTFTFHTYRNAVVYESSKQ